jgi:hypothetical protein
MEPELVQQLEDIITFTDQAEQENKQLLLKMRKVNDEIRDLRDFREKLLLKRNENIEKLKENAIVLENIAKKYGIDKAPTEYSE